MRLSRLFGLRLKETPSDAVRPGRALLLRGGYLRMVRGGACLLPPGLRVLRAIERVVREEFEALGAQEVRLEQTCLTSIDAVSLCRQDLNSYAQLPLSFFSFGNEPFSQRPPDRERVVLDDCGWMPFNCFAFYATHEEALAGLERYRGALRRILERLGLTDVLETGGNPAQTRKEHIGEEFILPDEDGETLFAEGAAGDWRVNLNHLGCVIPAYPEPPRPLEKVHTPGAKTIRELADFLGIEPRQTAKAVFFENDVLGRPVMALIRGDREVSEWKLSSRIGAWPTPASEARILAAGAAPGYASPMGIDPERCCIVVDETVRDSNNLVTGANEPDYHYLNFNLERDLPVTQIADIALPATGDLDLDGRPITVRRGGLLAGYALMGEYPPITFRDREGALRPPHMLHLMIPFGRLLPAIIEANHDPYGPLWPAGVAPWPVHLCALRMDAAGVRETADRLYSELMAMGIEALYDDRNGQPGVQFAEADLLGAPLRLTIGERGLKQGAVEWKRRATGESGTLPLAEAAATVKEWVEREMAPPAREFPF